jgi:uncharacterized protein YjbI with pentapeptide repeats
MLSSNFLREKTLYDWLQLVIIPAVLAVGAPWLTRLQQQHDQKLADQRAKIEQEAAEKRAQTEREISLDNQHEKALQAYIDNMSALLLEKDLRDQVQLDKVRKIARVRTLTVLRRLDGRRKAIVLNFLYESGLINKDQKIVDLDGADLSEADLFRAQLSKADLSRANLSKANLIEANLMEATLSSTVLFGADLSSAKLFRTDLHGVDLSEANLSEAIGISNEELEKEARSLQGATMPDGSIHD